MLRAHKEIQITQIRDRFARAASAVLTDFRGLDVEAINDLRSAFRKVDVEYKVVKNTLTKLAVKDQSYADALSAHLEGPTAIAWSYEDPVSSAKVIVDFAKTHEDLKIKCGILEGEVIDPQGVNQLSRMPGLNELKATLLATFMAPAQSFVRLIAAPATNFVYLLDARKRQLEENK